MKYVASWNFAAAQTLELLPTITMPMISKTMISKVNSLHFLENIAPPPSLHCMHKGKEKVATLLFAYHFLIIIYVKTASLLFNLFLLFDEAVSIYFPFFTL